MRTPYLVRDRSPRDAPGRGATHLEAAVGSYVYVVRSRRTGRVSVGIDLTPGGACTFACDYCQVRREGPRSVPGPVDLARLAEELEHALSRFGAEAGDVAFAGSGEPTWSTAFAEALIVARDTVRAHALDIPVRVFTSGRTLDHARVRLALVRLVWSDEGEAWVKLDAWDEASFRIINGVRGFDAHVARVVRFAREVPVVLQIMLARRESGPTLEVGASGLFRVLARMIDGSARIDRIVLGTLIRPPGNGTQGVRAIAPAELLEIADRFRTIAIDVVTAAPG